MEKVRSAKPEPLPNASKRSRTRVKLIEAASHVIAERGFDRASLEEIALRAGMTRGAVYGNFKNKEELLLAAVEEQWKPIIPPFKAGETFKQQMRIMGKTVAQVARGRRRFAAVATAFQLYVLTHPPMQAAMTERNAAAYQMLATALIKVIPASDLPMAAKDFVRVLDIVTTGLLFTYFQTPDLITEDVFLATFEALAPGEKNAERT